MKNKTIAVIYYLVLFLLPIIFYPKIVDYLLLPRQIYLSICLLILIVISFFKSINIKSEFEINRLYLLFILYLAIAIIGITLKSVVISESFYIISKQLLLFTYFFTTIYLLENRYITEKQVVRSVLGFTCLALFTVFYDIAEKTINGQHLFRQVDILAGGFANKNLLSSILFLCLPFTLIKSDLKKWKIIFRFLLLFVIASTILIIRTRSVIVGVLIFFLILVYFYFKEFIKWKLVWFLGLSVGLAGSLYYFIVENNVIGDGKWSTDIKMQYLYRLFDYGTIQTRLKFWENSFLMFKEHFLLGVGLGNWQIYFPKYGLDKFTDFNFVNGIMSIQRPHNDFLWVLCETGLLGFLAFYGIIGVIIYKIILAIKKETDSRLKWNLIFTYAGIVGYLVISFFDFPSERIEHQVLLMTLFSVGYYGSETHKNYFKISKSYFYVVSTLVICFSLVVTFNRIQGEKEIAKIYRGNKLNNTDYVLAHSTKALNLFYQIDFRTLPIDWYIGNAYFKNNQIRSSQQHFEKAYALTPYNILVIHNLASSNEILGNRKTAIDLYKTALKISSKYEDARLQLAAVYFNDKQYEKAFETIEKVSINTKNKLYLDFLIPILQSKIYYITQKNHIKTIPEKFRDSKYIVKFYFDCKLKKVNFIGTFLTICKNT